MHIALSVIEGVSHIGVGNYQGQKTNSTAAVVVLLLLLCICSVKKATEIYSLTLWPKFAITTPFVTALLLFYLLLFYFSKCKGA